MRKYSLKRLLVVLVACLVFASAAGAAQIEFGITSSKTKIGDGLSTSTYGNGHHNIVVSGDTVYAVYIIRNANRDYEVRLGVSLDGGLTWGGSKVIAYGPEIDSDGVGIDLGPDPQNPGAELIHLVWAAWDSVNSRNSVYYTRGALNASGRWVGSTPVVVSGAVYMQGHTATVSADDQGGVHITYITNSNVLYYTKLSSGGAVIDETATQVPLGISCYNPDAVADSMGNLNVACHSSPNTQYIRRDAATGTWGVLKQLNLDSAGLPVPDGFPSVAVLDTNNVYVSWGAGSSGVFIAISDDAGATWAPVEQVSQGNGWTSIAVDANGDLSVVWDTGNGIIGLSRGTMNGNSRSWTDPPISFETNSHLPSIALDASGKAIVLYDNYREDATYVTKEK